eukprot:TRINITY_DN23881_c0_g1_i1.p1 TRINITY_DN23881_c0_g1~~TRINITY_DN23881_c0_g1_i1.p1  ORF type:complete len:207 (-),score=18.13 TRINITY_DN23881_c0_g1_i1:74-694(-)
MRAGSSCQQQVQDAAVGKVPERGGAMHCSSPCESIRWTRYQQPAEEDRIYASSLPLFCQAAFLSTNRRSRSRTPPYAREHWRSSLNSANRSVRKRLGQQGKEKKRRKRSWSPSGSIPCAQPSPDFWDVSQRSVPCARPSPDFLDASQLSDASHRLSESPCTPPLSQRVLIERLTEDSLVMPMASQRSPIYIWSQDIEPVANSAKLK